MGVQEESSRASRVAWPGFLRGENAQVILERLSHGDPLRLCERASARLRERWILLDPDRAFHRALGVCADAAVLEDPPSDLAAWALAKIDLALEQLIQADRQAEVARPGVLDEDEREFPLLTECLMLDPQLVRTVSVAFNLLDELPRRAFYELLVEGRPVPKVIEDGPWDEDGLYVAVHQALAALTLDLQEDPPKDRGKKKKGKA